MRKIWLTVLAGITAVSLGGCAREAGTEQTVSPPASISETQVPASDSPAAETVAPSPTAAETEIVTAATSSPQETPSLPNTGETSKAEEERTPQEQELISMLDEIDQKCRLGEAGCSLKAVKIAAHLMNWGVGTPLTCDQIKAVTVSWLQSLGQTEQSEFAEKLQFVRDTYYQLLGENAQELLDEAGVTDAAYPWSSEPIETVEAVMQTVFEE